eukprot:106191-Pyramimonas_sp.AAC.1
MGMRRRQCQGGAPRDVPGDAPRDVPGGLATGRATERAKERSGATTRSPCRTIARTSRQRVSHYLSLLSVLAASLARGQPGAMALSFLRYRSSADALTRSETKSGSRIYDGTAINFH